MRVSISFLSGYGLVLFSSKVTPRLRTPRCWWGICRMNRLPVFMNKMKFITEGEGCSVAMCPLTAFIRDGSSKNLLPENPRQLKMDSSAS